MGGQGCLRASPSDRTGGRRVGVRGEGRSKKQFCIGSLKRVPRNSDIIEVDNLKRIRHVIKRLDGKGKETSG